MKLVIVILSDRDCEAVLEALVEKQFRVTRVASTGSFLRRGNSTLFIGTPVDKVDEALGLIHSKAGEPATQGQGRGMLFVLNVSHYEQL